LVWIEGRGTSTHDSSTIVISTTTHQVSGARGEVSASAASARALVRSCERGAAQQLDSGPAARAGTASCQLLAQSTPVASMDRVLGAAAAEQAASSSSNTTRHSKRLRKSPASADSAQVRGAPGA
jgi:hypothetical protein